MQQALIQHKQAHVFTHQVRSSRHWYTNTQTLQQQHAHGTERQRPSTASTLRRFSAEVAPKEPSSPSAKALSKLRVSPPTSQMGAGTPGKLGTWVDRPQAREGMAQRQDLNNSDPTVTEHASTTTVLNGVTGMSSPKADNRPSPGSAGRKRRYEEDDMGGGNYRI